MSTNQIKIEAKLHITEGMDVNTVLQKGSCGQKIAVKLFDFDGNGKLEGNEDDLMNNCVFKSEKGQLTINDKKSGSVTVLNFINCFKCWRKSLNPSYKSNRRAIKPILYEYLRKYMFEAGYKVYERPSLEADDVIGILATRRPYKSRSNSLYSIFIG
jgi:hypothetical protein